ncbi:MAG: CPBP family intramembrane metalloprotease [Candidatus Cardinium sp.]|uniref:CPBP family intramembrane glutamic endopeptidase n=1 Tax=Cardinium endosymbiont of Dermatophagoides farinae TaxID=2597823 RepID=UPI00118304C1|nr:CPBP family intramembrane glutamic endopeptidase [Cardinium endosymbiont of Dermatophagoides farinae]TSJ80913.1 CPBP family intramembrane metalloprotease [Cardinium endosymbiont of Dermatophagoides farinae]UWW96927.1 MAG: CPBP family intramembrane metalloprotease [Candidatus Cardinium sp.]
MGSKIKLVQRVMWSSIGLYLGMLFCKILIEPAGCSLLNHSLFEQFIVRIIICCITLRYYLHLEEPKGIQSSAQKCVHRPFSKAICDVEFLEEAQSPAYSNLLQEHKPQNCHVAIAFRKRSSGYSLTIGTILAQLMMTFALVLLSSIQAGLGYPTIQPVLHFSSKINFLYRGIIEISGLTAILEELLFRGILEKLLRRIIPARLWITIISALAFSLMHGNMRNNLLYFVMGCFLSYLYHQTKHIIYPIIAHGLHNLCATSIIYLTLDKRLDCLIHDLTIVTRILLAIGLLLAAYGYVTLIGQKTQKHH